MFTKWWGDNLVGALVAGFDVPVRDISEFSVIWIWIVNQVVIIPLLLRFAAGSGECVEIFVCFVIVPPLFLNLTRRDTVCCLCRDCTLVLCTFP
jgi:hypothetical protein